MENYYWTKYLVFKILLIGFISFDVSAQIPGSSQQNIDLEEEKNRLERYYESQLNNEFSDYFEKNKYLIDAQVEISQVKIPSSYERSDKRDGQMDGQMDPGQLPGLPVLPRHMTQEVDEDTLKPDKYNSALQIDRLVIRVIVDTSYSSSDIEFAEELATSTANLDVVRGDQVIVDTRAFPEKGRVSVADTAAGDEEVERNQESAIDEAFPFDLNNPSLLRFLIIGLIILVFLLIVGFSIWIYRLKKARNKDKTDEDHALENLKTEVQNLKTDTKDQQNGEEGLSPEQNALYEKDRTYVTNQIISHPNKVANLLEQWINSDPENGVNNAARAINASNPKLLSALNRYMKRNNYKTLKNTLDNIEGMSKEEKMEMVQTFRKSLQNTMASEDGEDTDHDIFNFLNQLSDDQILHLFKDESNNMIAIALAQLDGERASRILQSIDEDRRPSILVQMGNIHNLSIETYKEAANYFSEKALKIISMKYVVADGVKSILDLIDTLPVDKQEQYVQSIAENDLDLAQRVRKYFIAFSDIPEIKDEHLQEALEDLETETLITALMGAEQEIIDKLLSVRPQREQQLIRYEIENRPDYKDSEIDSARKKLIMKIRNKTKYA